VDEQCIEELAPGLRCQRPEGHDGEHMMEGEVPESIGRMLASMMEHAEQAERRARRAYRLYMAGIVFWIILSAWQAFNILNTLNGAS
jgi:hypothetical protein